MKFRIGLLNLLLLIAIILWFSNCSQKNSARDQVLKALELNSTEFEILDDFEKVDLLRFRLSSLINRGYTPESHWSIEAQYPDWHQKEIAELLAILKSEPIHLSCGKVSYLLREIYFDFGWEATTFNFGIDGTPFTHEVTLVECCEQDKVLMEDAYFNATLQDSLGRALDFFDFIRELKISDIPRMPNHFEYDSIVVSLFIDASVSSTYQLNCHPGFVLDQQPNIEDVIVYDYLVYQPLALYDSCYGIMTELNRELDSALIYEQLFLNRISEMLGKPEWQQRYDQLVKP